MKGIENNVTRSINSMSIHEQDTICPWLLFPFAIGQCDTDAYIRVTKTNETLK